MPVSVGRNQFYRAQHRKREDDMDKKMKDMSCDYNKMYPSAVGEASYPTITVSKEFFEENSMLPGDKVELEIEGEIESVNKGSVTIKLKEGYAERYNGDK